MAKVASVEIAPVVAPVAVAPMTAAPKVIAPASKLSTVLPPGAPVAVAPVVTSRPMAAAPIKTPLSTALGIPKTTLVLHAAPLPSKTSGQIKAKPELVTATGSVYKDVEVERVMSDGIIISYTPAGGGWAMTKVNFTDLSPQQQQLYGKH